MSHRAWAYMPLGQDQVADLLSPLTAKLQAEVGIFLAARQWLLNARRAALTPEQAARIETLLTQQTALEAELGQVLPPIQSGTYSVSSVTSAAAFLAKMELHLSAVKDLQRALPGVAGMPIVSINWSQVALWGGMGLAGLGLVMRSPMLMVGGAGVAGVGFYLGS